MTTYERQRARSRHNTKLADYAGDPCAKGARRWIVRQAANMSFDDEPITDWLTKPLTTTVKCLKDTNHTVTISGLHTIELHNHTYEDLDAELLLAALSGQRPAPCLITWAIGQTGTPPVAAPGQVDSNHANAWQMFFTARDWAHNGDPDMPDKDRETLISMKVGPADWAEWAKYGRSPGAVKQFLRAGATPEQADPWLVRNLFGFDAANAAAQGRTPDIDYEAWAVHGFTEPQAGRWYTRVGCTPEQAAIFRDHDEDAERVQKAIKVVALTDLLDWVQAGFSVKNSRSWLEANYPMSHALTWAKIDISSDVINQAASLRAHATTPGVRKPGKAALTNAARTLDPDTVQAWLNAGVPHWLLPQALATGHDPQPLIHWGGLPDLDRYRDIGVPFNAWWTLINTMTKPEWDAWHTVPFMAETFRRNYHTRVRDLTEIHAAGLTPTFFTDLPTTRRHTSFYRARTILLAVEKFNGDVPALSEAGARGWFSDRILGETLPDRTLSVIFTNLAILFVENPNMGLPEVYRRRLGWLRLFPGCCPPI